MLDVLHHIEYPIRFFKDAARALQPGGRLIFVEPGITPLSDVIYRALHEEPVDASSRSVDGRHALTQTKIHMSVTRRYQRCWRLAMPHSCPSGYRNSS